MTNKDEKGWLAKTLKQNEIATKDMPEWKKREGRIGWDSSLKEKSVSKKKVVSITEKELTMLICSFPIPFGGMEEVKDCPEEYQELTHFTGNQYNDEWGWYDDEIECMPLNDKLKLLAYLRKL